MTKAMHGFLGVWGSALQPFDPQSSAITNINQSRFRHIHFKENNDIVEDFARGATNVTIHVFVTFL